MLVYLVERTKEFDVDIASAKRKIFFLYLESCPVGEKKGLTGVYELGKKIVTFVNINWRG